MSMCGYLLRITEEQLQELIDAPYLIDEVIRVDGAEPSPDALAIGPDGKDWHLFHYLLTGSQESASGPLADAIIGGTAIGDDIGYGPASYLTPDEVRSIASALDDIPTAVLLSRFDAQALSREEIYAGDSWQDGDGSLEELAATYEELCGYYRKAAASGCAMLKWIE